MFSADFPCGPPVPLPPPSRSGQERQRGASRSCCRSRGSCRSGEVGMAQACVLKPRCTWARIDRCVMSNLGTCLVGVHALDVQESGLTVRCVGTAAASLQREH